MDVANAMVQERREKPRRRVLYEGRIVFNSRYSIIECMVRDMSEMGARIAFEHPIEIPREVELEIPRTGQRFEARVRWSRGRLHGLSFVPAPTGRDGAFPHEIQAVIDQARRRIAQLAGLSPDAVRLRLELDR